MATTRTLSYANVAMKLSSVSDTAVTNAIAYSTYNFVGDYTFSGDPVGYNDLINDVDSGAADLADLTKNTLTETIAKQDVILVYTS